MSDGLNWLGVADFAFVSHLWLGGWSFLVLRTWMYRTMELIFLTALVGQVGNLRRVGNPPGRVETTSAGCHPAPHQTPTFERPDESRTRNVAGKRTVNGAPSALPFSILSSRICAARNPIS